jgi:hypothetical protein
MKTIWILILIGVLIGVVCADTPKPWQKLHHEPGHESGDHHGDDDSKDDHHDHHKKPHHSGWKHTPHFGGPKDRCHYRDSKGVDYDFRLMEHSSHGYRIDDSHSRIAFYLNPCGSMAIPGCDPDAAVCAVDPEGKRMTIGLNSIARWADGADGANVEVAYGGGEKTDDGIPRKAIVEYRCALPPSIPALDIHKPVKPEELTPAVPNPRQVSRSDDTPKITTETAITRLVSVAWDGATLRLVMASPYACPVLQYCAATVTEAACEASEGTCHWVEPGTCEAVPKSCFLARGGAVAVVLLLFMAIGCMSIVATCLCCCGCYALNRRKRCCRNRRNSALPTTQTTKHVKKTHKKLRGVKKSKRPMPQPMTTPSAPVYHPQQQLNPLTYVPMHMYPQFNPYTAGQAIPMVPVASPQNKE